MKHIMAVTALALAACSHVPRAPAPAPAFPPAPEAVPVQGRAPLAAPAAQAPQAARAPQERSAPDPAAQADNGLSDLAAVTLGCPKAALNAAAREASGAPTEGSYQFAYFRIINDAHHAAYEVGFRSNYHGEPELTYCVSMYCQQGWDPKTTKASVRLMAPARVAAGTAGSAGAAGAAGAAAPQGVCGREHGPMRRRSTR